MRAWGAGETSRPVGFGRTRRRPLPIVLSGVGLALLLLGAHGSRTPTSPRQAFLDNVHRNGVTHGRTDEQLVADAQTVCLTLDGSQQDNAIPGFLSVLQPVQATDHHREVSGYDETDMQAAATFVGDAIASYCPTFR